MGRALYSKLQQSRIDEGKCIEGCGADIPPLVLGQKWQQRRCKSCCVLATQERIGQLARKGCKLCKKRVRVEGQIHCAECAEAAQAIKAEAQTTPAHVMQVLSRKQRILLRKAIDKINQRPDAEEIFALASRLERRHRASLLTQEVAADDEFRLMTECLDRAVCDTDRPDPAPVLMGDVDRHNVRKFDVYVSPRELI